MKKSTVRLGDLEAAALNPNINPEEKETSSRLAKYAAYLIGLCILGAAVVSFFRH